MTDIIDVSVDRVATGGAGIGLGPDGRIVFVAGAIPGERVRARIQSDSKRFRTASILEVIDASQHRRTVECPHVADGCGGCDWQHVDPREQRRLRRDIVLDSLRRLGHLEDVDVRLGPTLPEGSYRTTVRAGVIEGQAAHRKAASHDLVQLDECLTAHPLAAELLVDGHFGSANEVTIKVGARTSERMVVVDPIAEGVRVPDDVIVVGTDELRAGRTAYIHEEVAGFRYRISAHSFFQCRPDGAEVLIGLVNDVVGQSDGPVLDAYCGVGLFGAQLDRERRVVGVESSGSSCRDARANLAGRVEVIQSQVERWTPEPMSTVIADPARRGLQARAVDVLVETKAPTIALVSCDPAALARDARLLTDGGYHLDHVTVIDMFGHTSHVEAVSSFTRQS